MAEPTDGDRRGPVRRFFASPYTRGVLAAVVVGASPALCAALPPPAQVVCMGVAKVLPQVLEQLGKASGPDPRDVTPTAALREECAEVVCSKIGRALGRGAMYPDGGMCLCPVK